MSRESRREIEQAIEQLDTEEDDIDIEIEVEVTTVAPENIGERETTVPGSRIVFDEDSE